MSDDFAATALIIQQQARAEALEEALEALVRVCQEERRVELTINRCSVIIRALKDKP